MSDEPADIPWEKRPLPQQRKPVIRVDRRQHLAPAQPPGQGGGGLKKGDIIGGKYQIQGLLGKGGMGEVYLVKTGAGEYWALKTFRRELMRVQAAGDAFRKEALLWVKLDQHPHILAARWIEVFGGRMFVQMDLVARDSAGRVTLGDHLAGANGPLSMGQVLDWAVQFCLGMEHAVASGIRCHRDIKPGNILITKEGVLKVSDFGLASAAEQAWARGGGADMFAGHGGGFGMSMMPTRGNARCGTPGYMAPEIYRGDGADIRSDIYAFGLVLWQMATGSATPPYFVRDQSIEACLSLTYLQQINEQVPPGDEALQPIIERCLRPAMKERYTSFAEVRVALESIMEEKGAKKMEIQEQEKTAMFWNNKAGSLITLRQYHEALTCCDNALALDPGLAIGWNSKGVALRELGKLKEAIGCYEKALEINPQSALAWRNKGIAVAEYGWQKEAVAAFDKALELNPQDALSWFHKANVLSKTMPRRPEALTCYDKAIQINPRLSNAWFNRGLLLHSMKRSNESRDCFEKFLQVATPQQGELIAVAQRNIAILNRMFRR